MLSPFHLEFVPLLLHTQLTHLPRNRPDTIRCIVASLVGDGESGDSLVDDSEPVQPLAQVQHEDYSDPNWEPEPVDAGPGACSSYLLTTPRCGWACPHAFSPLEIC
jgi:hypothetical protein